MLFSKGPFISIFASDPHIIIKAINQNLNSVLRDSNINGHDYMRNIVHLPVFLNSRGLSTARKLCTATATAGPAPANGDATAADGSEGGQGEEEEGSAEGSSMTQCVCVCVCRLARGAGQEVVSAQSGRADQVRQQDHTEPPGESHDHWSLGDSPFTIPQLAIQFKI